MLNVARLSKRYGRNMAIDEISFQIRQGEIVGLVGHNGCGKSTTMKIISGYLNATSGTVRIDGEILRTDDISIRKKIGYMPEVPPLYTDMTVGEQLRFACELKGIRQAGQALQEAARKADIQPVLGRLIGHLSKGYRQRVGLAQALVGNPPILILDEPTSGLDPRQIVEMRAMIQANASEHAVLMSSHVLPEISAMCDRLVVLSNGKLVADDHPDALRERFRKKGLYAVTFCADAAQFQQNVQSTPGIDLVHLAQTPRKESWDAQIHADDAIDAGRAVWDILSNVGGRVIRFAPVVPDLEEVFLNLTQDKRYAEGKERG